MREHCKNASAVADYPTDHTQVSSVIYPGKQSGETKYRAEKYLNGGFGGLVGFELHAGELKGKKFEAWPFIQPRQHILS